MRNIPNYFTSVHDVIVSELEQEVLIYDLGKHRAHCLSLPAYQVFRSCDGTRDQGDLAAFLKVELSLVERTVDELVRAGLVIPPRGHARRFGRRRAMKQIALTAGLSVAMPMVWSIAAPSVAQAASVNCPTNPGGCKANNQGSCCGTAGGEAGTCIDFIGINFCARGAGSCGGDTCR
jgi:hypothetical protein